MKTIYKLLATLIALTLVLSLVPAMEAPASAASTPVLVLSSTTAVNPILDHVLDFDTYSTGGPFTVSWEWKTEIKSNDPADPTSFKAGVSVTGFIYGTTDVYQWDAGFEGYNPPKITGRTDWTKGSFQFQNVGTYPMTGTSVPGNILRFSLWKARGSVYIRNLTIKNNAGDVLYNLNTDSVVAQAVANMESLGMTEADISELAAIDYANCPWVAGQFSTGKYSSSIQLESDGNTGPTSSSSITRPTTTKPTTAKPTTVKPTAVPSSVAPSDPTPVPSTDPATPTDPTESAPPEPTSEPTQPATQAPTTQTPTAPSTDNVDQGVQDDGGKVNPIIFVIIGLAVLAVAGAVVYFLVLKKKK
jgi:hypothetical protein